MNDKPVLSQYDYELPEELIAKVPVEPRDSSRLFVYDTASDTVTLDVFANLDQYLPADSFLVFNDTKVVPARLMLKKPTGGKVEILLLLNEPSPNPDWIKALSDRKISVGDKLSLPNSQELEVMGQDENVFFLKPLFDRSRLNDILQEYGVTPVPKYLGSPLSEGDLRQRYQTVFAKNPASVAAPTASLHFTPAVLQKIKAKNIPTVFVTLHVGLGTFAPVTEENIRSRELHEEYLDITSGNRQFIADQVQLGKRLIAAGTTATRAIESAAGAIIKHLPLAASTKLFIYPPFDFQLVSGMITNFHLPGSSLISLVDALLQHKQAKRSVLDLYRIAIENKFRFYSFGDAMLIL